MTAKGLNRYSKLDESIERENDDFIINQDQQHQMISRETDQDLEALGGTLETLHAMGKTINQEVQVSTKMIEQLDQDMEGTQGRMAKAIRRVNNLLETTSERNSWIIVGVLVIILILVIMAVIFT